MEKIEENKILHLTLKKKWFDMIRSGEKTEEYRAIKKYWIDRFKPWQDNNNGDYGFGFIPKQIVFTNGYGKDKPSLTIECEWLDVGEGKKEWGWEEHCFILKLGKKISETNL